jgi:Transposase IS116/IS110/IS902 family
MAAPALVAINGVGTQTAAALLVAAGDNPERLRSEAAFAHLCGVAPIPASSGKTTRHRLNRGGNREANWALYLIAVGRMAWHEPTRAYLERRTKQGKSKAEIIRCFIGRVSAGVTRNPGSCSSVGVRGRPRCCAARRPVSVLPPLALRGPNDRRQGPAPSRAKQ